jgi:phosphate-selective porin OprO/OprP
MAVLGVGALTLQPEPAHAQEPSAGISERIAKLESEIALLKRQQEVQEEKDKAVAEKTANVEFGKKGLKITSPDKNYELSLRGTFQFDSRQFLNDEKNTGKDDLLARRLRPVLEAKAGNASFRLMPDFAGSTTRIFDAHADYKLNDAVQFRFGKFKTPVSLERLQSPGDMFAIERGHPSNLAPSRDFGFMVYGNPVPDIVEYQLGVFNGNADLANTDGDDDDKKDVAARVFVQPFRNAETVALQGLGVGLAGSIGDREGSATKTILGSYKTPGQQDFFKYRSDAFADGEHWRLYPQAYWYAGNTGLLAEYAISNQDVTRGADHDTLQHTAWQVVGSYVLTGEDVNFRGGIKPTEDFDLTKGGKGAWEVTARIGQTDVDDAAFGRFADLNASASKAQSYGSGLNWYLSENLKLMANYDFTTFDGGAAGGEDRPDEHALFTRAQFRF